MSAVYRFLRSYAALTFFVGTLGIKLIEGATSVRIPVPQVPAAGHLAYEYRLRLAWADDGLEPPFLVQVTGAEENFDTPTVELRAEQSSVILPPLEPGREWRWRVVHVATGRVSTVSYFRTADYRVNY